MKKLAIIGGNGTLGSDLVKYLRPFFSITSITKDNYPEFKGSKLDVVINANGNSRRFWANQNPLDDFLASTLSVYKTIFDFPCDIYIYISSPDVYENHTSSEYTKEDQPIDPKKLQSYGFHKYLSELIVKKHKEKFLILRSAMILGNKAKKGPIYDLINNKPLFVTSESQFQLITTKAIAEIIRILLEKFKQSEIINMGGIGTFSFSRIDKYFGKNRQILKDAEKQVYEMNVKKLKRIFPNLKTSVQYLEDFLKELNP